MILALTERWTTRQIDFVMAYTQAKISSEVYMAIPQGMQVNEQENNSNYCLKLLMNLYGGKDAGRTWNQHLHKALIKFGFTQSTSDKCIYF